MHTFKQLMDMSVGEDVVLSDGPLNATNFKLLRVQSFSPCNNPTTQAELGLLVLSSRTRLLPCGLSLVLVFASQRQTHWPFL